MKRILSVFLVFALTLSLSGCFAFDDDRNGEYANLIHLLQVGNYEAAHAEIDRLAGITPAPVEAAPEADALSTPEVSEAPRPDWFSLIFGEWSRLYLDDEGKVETLTIREDGTAVLDGSEAQWVFDYYNESIHTAIFHLLVNGTEIGGFHCKYTESGDLEAYIKLEELDNESLYLYKPADYEIISVGLDNWQEYFEYRYEMHYQDDAFGDFSRCWYTTKLCLKPEYAARVSAYLTDDVFNNNVIPGGALEYSYDAGNAPFHMDTVTREYTIGEPTTERSDTYVVESYYNDEDTVYFQLATHNFGDYEIENETAYNFWHNCVPIRMDATLCLIAE